MSIDEFTQFRSSLDFETFKAYKFALITLLTFKHGDNHFNSHTSYTKMCVVFCSSFFSLSSSQEKHFNFWFDFFYFSIRSRIAMKIDYVYVFCKRSHFMLEIAYIFLSFSLHNHEKWLEKILKKNRFLTEWCCAK